MNRRESLANTWIRFHIHKDEKDFWAFEEFLDLVTSNPQEAWSTTKLIFDLAPSEDVRTNLAAGPVEDLLHAHGHAFIDELEILCRQNPLFGKMIKSVWTEGMQRDVQEKMKAIQTKYGNTV